MSKSQDRAVSFHDLNLPAPLLKALQGVGYESASPIQAQAIPHLMRGEDILGHAPTGTGKTAAFALPLLARLDTHNDQVQVLTLTPTRELAIQVAEAFQRYASHIKGFHVLPIYGGQDYGGQIRQLKRGVHVVVGTPGRVMDHMRRGTLKLGGLQALVLDEADEMLRMGFVDEVEWILEQTPPKRQMALFSATMPKQIETIARRHLDQPQKVSVRSRTATAETIRQRFWQVSGAHKLDALTRILEVELFDAVLLFVRTKTATAELAERLEARGYAAAAMNGDMAQKQRELTVERLKKGAIDILVATDVAARGLDVDRISHVINYDIPYDTEAYIHRIGRTGRAGRTGEAILFVAPRERGMLAAIERATKQKIAQLEMPSTEVVNNQRIAKFKQRISDTLAAGELDFMQSIVEQYQQEHDVPPLEIAAALAHMTMGDKPLLLKPAKRKLSPSADEAIPRLQRRSRDLRHRDKGPRANARRGAADPDMQRFRVEVGLEQGVEVANIVGAIANEAGLDSQHIGLVDIHPTHSTVELPKGMPKDIFKALGDAWVCGRQLRISRADHPDKSNKPANREPVKRKTSANKAASPNKASKGKSAAKRTSNNSTAAAKSDKRPTKKSKKKRNVKGQKF